MNSLFKNKVFRFFINFFEILIVVILVMLLIAVAFQRFSGNKAVMGYRIFTVGSSSMIPNYTVGDTLLISDVPIKDIKVGDAVTYIGEEDQVKDLIITHRVEKIESGDTELLYHTKGVANNIEDPIVHEHQILGKVVHKFFFLSLLNKATYNMYLLFLFITVPLAFLIVIEIIKVTREKEEDSEEESEEEEKEIKENKEEKEEKTEEQEDEEKDKDKEEETSEDDVEDSEYDW